jgi:hypothetical protein
MAYPCGVSQFSPRLAATAVAIWLSGCALLAGCGTPPSTEVPTHQAVAEATQKLEGRYRLVSFEPEQPLSGPFQALLDYQMQVMVIHIGGGRIVTEAPGITFDRRYEVTSADGQRFRATSYDEGGLPYDAQCQWSDDGQSLNVFVETSPWRGFALLQRLP